MPLTDYRTTSRPLATIPVAAVVAVAVAQPSVAAQGTVFTKQLMLTTCVLHANVSLP